MCGTGAAHVLHERLLHPYSTNIQRSSCEWGLGLRVATSRSKAEQFNKHEGNYTCTLSMCILCDSHIAL